MINLDIQANSGTFSTYYQHPRTKLLGLLDERRPSVALEIGCGVGANLYELKKRWPTIHTIGIEIRPEAAALGKTYGYVDEMHNVDIWNDQSIEFPQGSIDVMIMSHVLEHFPQPDRVLERVLPWLSRDGRVLVALPNVRHLSVIIELLFKKDFHYREMGILDSTHLRFFTRKSMERLLLGHGLLIERCEPDIEGRNSRLLNMLTLGFGCDLASHAYNFLLSKP